MKKTKFFRYLESTLATNVTSENLILGGDWNIALANLDRKPRHNEPHHSKRAL